MFRWFRKKAHQQKPPLPEWQQKQAAWRALQEECYQASQKVVSALKGYAACGCTAERDPALWRSDNVCLKWNGRLYLPGDGHYVRNPISTPIPLIPETDLEALINALHAGLLEDVKIEIARLEASDREARLRIERTRERLRDNRGSLVSPADAPLVAPVKAEAP